MTEETIVRVQYDIEVHDMTQIGKLSASSCYNERDGYAYKRGENSNNSDDKT